QRLRYEPKKLLGEGGIGEVMSVEDHDIGRMAAMKRLRADVRSPAAIARFVDEIRTVGRLEHPNIIPIHDVGVDEQGELYFVMKYLDGETLETVLEKLAAGEVGYHSRYGFETRMQIFRGLLEAIAFAHARGVLHRDIKPANVMIGRYGEVVLMDWGIAKPIAGEGRSAADYAAAASEPAGDERARLFETQVGSLIGTPAYMAPEQARGEPCDARSEVYSLSVLLHEMLTLHHYLADCTTMSELLEGVGKRTPQFPTLVKDEHQGTPPADLSWYVMKGLEKDPAKRYQTVAEMLERLDLRAEGIIPIQCPFTFNRRVTAEWRRFYERHPIVGNLMVLSLVAAFGFLSFRGITR
ncbi:MAG TPA: serine/threonine-protein kinase, partial [Polyangiaceae bacterium]